MWKAIKREFQYEIERYNRTKLGKAGAVIIYYLLFTFVPTAMKIIVPFLSSYMRMEFVYLVITVGIVSGMTIIYNSVMYFVYILKIPFFEQYRCDPKQPWPWQQDQQKWRKVLWRSIKLISFSTFVILPILLLIDTSLQFNINMDVANPPSISQMMPYFIVFQIMEDIMFFLAHRLLHQPYLYSFHKIHHQYTTSVSIAGLHSHFVEFLISNSATAGIYLKMGQAMFGPMHVNVAAIWTILRMWDAYNGHCGYMFSWAPLQLLPFCASDDYHNFHHSKNCGNYAGQFRILDSLFGYNKDFWQYKEKQKKAMKLIKLT